MKNWKSFEFSHEIKFSSQAEENKKQKSIKIEHLVYHKGDPQNPGVILLHELPGMTPECVGFAEELVTEGYCVYLPLLFGKPYTLGLDRTLNLIRGTFCLWKEFNCFAIGEDSPISEWLKALSTKINQDHGGKGIGVIGMCLTGGFVLSMMVDESILAPVISQPSLPIYFFRLWNKGKAKRDLGVSETTINDAKKRNLPILAFKFETDRISPCERFTNLQQKFSPTINLKNEDPKTYTFDKGLLHHYVITTEQIKQGKKDGFPHKGDHSVLTIHYVDNKIDGKKHPTREARDWVVTFLKNRLPR